MARVTAVINARGGASETFLAALVDGLVAAGHEVTRHELRPPSGPLPPGHSAALPAARSTRFAPAAARLALAERAAVVSAARRARARFGATARAARAAGLAAPILATRPDLVYLAFSGIAVTLADAIELLDGIEVLVSCRGSGELVVPVLDPARGAALGRVLGQVSAVHAVSSSVAAAVAELGVDPSRITVVRPGVDPGRFARGVPRRPIGSPLRLVAVSRLHWAKGLDDLIDALAELGRRGIDARLTVVGGGAFADALTYRAHVLGVAERVDLRGSQPSATVAELVESADVFVLPSLSEGISNAVLEAMALEVPVVSTMVSGMPEVITDGVDGLLVPPGQPSALAAAVERLGREPALAANLAAAGRRRVLADFTLDRQRAELAALVQQALRAGRPDVGDGGRDGG